jgi:hypothetical protein
MGRSLILFAMISKVSKSNLYKDDFVISILIALNEVVSFALIKPIFSAATLSIGILNFFAWEVEGIFITRNTCEIRIIVRNKFHNFFSIIVSIWI